MGGESLAEEANFEENRLTRRELAEETSFGETSLTRRTIIAVETRGHDRCLINNSWYIGWHFR